MKDLVYGVGVNDGKYPSWVNGKVAKEYHLWNSLLLRCYNPKHHKRQPTYIGCTTSENFKNYSYFHDWCQNQIGFNQEGYQLDKDLILKGNKLYSEDTCLFIPSELNTLLINRRLDRGNLPIGVSAHQGRFRVRCCKGSPNRHIGLFNTAEEAFAAYKRVKEAFIRLQAEKWRAFIDPRAYEALISYTVSITD